MNARLPMIMVDNQHVVVVDKDAETLSVPSRIGVQDERYCVGMELQKHLGIQIYPVHRLDFDVSGILVFAKTPEAQRLLNQCFEKSLVKKCYQAFCSQFSHPKTEEVWNSKILRGKKRAYESPVGKPAETLSKLHLSHNFGLEFKLYPKTGRAHQLRFQMATFAAPILGDRLYGDTSNFKGPGIALRHIELSFSDRNLAGELNLPNVISATPLGIENIKSFMS